MGFDPNRWAFRQAGVFAQSAPHAGVFDDDWATARVERDCLAREGTGVPARFARNTDKGQTYFRVDRGHAHAHVSPMRELLESVSRTGRNALQFFLALAKVARFIPRDQIGRPDCDCRIGTGGTEHLRGADFYALGAADASGQEFILVARAGRT